jgi:ABC-2 type transport system permease protein
MTTSFFRAAWALARKDLRVWLRQPVTIAVTLVPPLVFILVGALAAQAVGRSPVALVNQDAGPEGAHITQAIEQADVFRLHTVSTESAQTMLRNLDVVAIITIPNGFSSRVAAHEPSPIDVTVNNLNLDFTNDIRRAVPDAITQYYMAQGDASPIAVTMREHDLRSHDIELYQYQILPSIVLLLMISGLVNGGLAAAREWESSSIKELLLSPTSRGALTVGKAAASAITTFSLGLLTLLLTVALGWVHPEGIYWVTTVAVMALIALFSSCLGIAIGSLAQRTQPVATLGINVAIYLYFLAGGIGVLAFQPDWLQQIAVFDPLTYGDHALEMAIFYSSADLLARDIAVLASVALAAAIVATLAMRRGIAR